MKHHNMVGIGPTGAVISLLLLAIFVCAGSMGTLSLVVAYAGPMETIGIVLVIFGLFPVCVTDG